MSKNKNYIDIDKFEDKLIINEYDYETESSNVITEIEGECEYSDNESQLKTIGIAITQPKKLSTFNTFQQYNPIRK